MTGSVLWEAPDDGFPAITGSVTRTSDTVSVQVTPFGLTWMYFQRFSAPGPIAFSAAKHFRFRMYLRSLICSLRLIRLWLSRLSIQTSVLPLKVFVKGELWGRAEFQTLSRVRVRCFWYSLEEDTPDEILSGVPLFSTG